MAELHNKITNIDLLIKIAIYLLLVLPVIIADKFSFISSIIFLILSIVFIWFGFKNKIKSFRLYGLFLSMFSIAKLLIVDIGSINSIFRVLGLILAGILCLVIVFTYNKMSEKIDD